MKEFFYKTAKVFLAVAAIAFLVFVIYGLKTQCENVAVYVYCG